jgi:sec-independent protein translocase protein TatC
MVTDAALEQAQEKAQPRQRGSATLMSHLRELRKRLLYSVWAILIATCGSFLFAKWAFQALLAPAPPDITFIYTGIMTMALTYAKVALYSGLALVTPFILYQLIAFIDPALTRKEKRYLYSMLPMILLFFLIGVAYCYFLFLPPSLKLFITFHWVPQVGTQIVPMIDIGGYISFVAKCLLWVGLAFEFPVIVFLLAKFHLVSHKWLLKQWKWATAIILIMSALITPTGNPLNQSFSEIFWLDLGFIGSVPLLALYFLGVFLAWFARRPQKKLAAEPEGA